MRFVDVRSRGWFAQLEDAMRRIDEVGEGVIVYIRGHEGRGIGLRHKLEAYALQDKGFDTVEANSTYYRLPEAELVANWAERTPEGFTMHVKAFGLMTRHPVKLEALPEAQALRDSAEAPH